MAGDFDSTLLKPVSTLFFVSLRNWSPWALLQLAVSLAILGLGVAGSATGATVGNLGLFVASILVSIVVVYSLLLILNSAAFWYLGVPMSWVYESVIQMGRFPISVYPVSLRFLLTWVIPVGFIVTVPAEVLTGARGVTRVGGGLALAMVLLYVATRVFRAGLSRYSSASS